MKSAIIAQAIALAEKEIMQQERSPSVAIDWRVCGCTRETITVCVDVLDDEDKAHDVWIVCDLATNTAKVVK